MSTIYTAKAGDTFESVAKKYRVSAADLRRFNTGYNGGDRVSRNYEGRQFRLNAGDRVRIPMKGAFYRTFRTSPTVRKDKNAAGRPYTVIQVPDKVEPLTDIVKQVDTAAFFVASRVGEVSKVLEESAGKSRLGVNKNRLKGFDFKNGINIYHETKNGGVFFGNAAVKTYGISHMAGTLERYMSIADRMNKAGGIVDEAIKEGEVGDRTQQKIGGVVGNEVGSKIGTGIVTAGCAYFGIATEGLGLAVCGVVGGVVGGEVGEAMGEAGTKQFQEGMKEADRILEGGVNEVLAPDPFDDPLNYN